MFVLRSCTLLKSIYFSSLKIMYSKSRTFWTLEFYILYGIHAWKQLNLLIQLDHIISRANILWVTDKRCRSRKNIFVWLFTVNKYLTLFLSCLTGSSLDVRGCVYIRTRRLKHWHIWMWQWSSNNLRMKEIKISQ